MLCLVGADCGSDDWLLADSALTPLDSAAAEDSFPPAVLLPDVWISGMA